ELLAQGERSVEALAERVGLSMANASQHLRLMHRTGLLASRRDGKRILYRLNDSSVLKLTAALHRVAERNVADVREVIRGYFHERDALARSEEHTSELQSPYDLVCRLLLEKKKPDNQS